MSKLFRSVLGCFLLLFLAACNASRPTQPYQGVTSGGGTTGCFGGGCSGTGGGGGGTPAASANFFVFLTAHGGDSVGALSFDLSSITLTKSDTTTTPFGANLSSLEVAGTRLSPRFVAAATVPAASYVTMTGTLASGTEVVAGSNTVNTLSPSTPTVAIPISVTVGTSPVAILLDMDIDASITPGTPPTYSPKFIVTNLTLGATVLQALIDDQIAKVTTIDLTTSKFDVTLNMSGIVLTVKTDAATGFGGSFGATPLVSLSDLQVNDVVVLNGVLDTDLSLLAARVDAEFRGTLTEQTGMINALTIPPASGFVVTGKVAARETVPSAPVASSDFNVPSTATFAIQAEALNASAFAFDSTTVLVGQGIGLQEPSPAPQPISTVLLKMETIRGQVSGKGSNFIDITPSGGEFTSQGVTTVRIVIDPMTFFTNTSLGALLVGDKVSARGLLLLVAATPNDQLLAKTVRKD